MTVTLIVVLKFIINARNSSGWMSGKVDMFILLVFNGDCEGFLQTLTLIVCGVCISSGSTFTRGIGLIYTGFHIRADPLAIIRGGCLGVCRWSCLRHM